MHVPVTCDRCHLRFVMTCPPRGGESVVVCCPECGDTMVVFLEGELGGCAHRHYSEALAG